MTYLTDLADAARLSGLTVVELPGWQSRGRPGAFAPRGVLCHHTGGEADGRAYVDWMALEGRPDLPAPLCQLALSRTGVVYVLAAGRANHGGSAKAAGPMPAGDANALYVGVEALNTGSEGWTDVQRDAYARLCAALCRFYGWPAPHVRAHRETSTTGKWDPGLLDMDEHRATVARLLDDGLEDDVAAQDVWHFPLTERDDRTKATERSAEFLLADAHRRAGEAAKSARKTEHLVRALAKALGPEVEASVEAALADAVIDVNVTVGKG